MSAVLDPITLALLNTKAKGDWVYDESSRRYRDERSGKFMDPSTRLDLRNEVTARHKERMAATTQDLIDGKLTPAQWEKRMQSHIQNAQVQQFAFGRGGRAMITDADKAVIGANVNGQHAYLAGFRADVELGDLSDKQILARAGMYANANSAAYEAGWVAAFGMPDLDQYPGDGQTQCKTNCNCSLDIVELKTGWSVYWKLNPGENCDDCVAMSDEWDPLRVERGD